MSSNSQQKAKATFPSAASITPRLVIDPTQTFECFDFETKIKQKYETALAIDKKELESILKDMEVLKEDFTLWSHGRIFHEDTKNRDSMTESENSISVEEKKQRLEREKVAEFLESFKEVFKILANGIKF